MLNLFENTFGKAFAISSYMNKYKTLIPSLYLTLLFMASSANAKLSLYVGEQKNLRLDGMVKVAIENPAVLDAWANDQTSSLTITGLSSGQSMLTIWLKNHQKKQMQFNVIQRKTLSFRQVQNMLSKTKGVKTRLQNDQIVIEGQVYSPKDLRKILSLSQQSNIANLSSFNPKVLNFLKSTIERKFFEQGYAQLSLNQEGQVLWIKGHLSDKTQIKKALIIAKNIYPLIETDVGQNQNQSSMILVDVKFLEVQKNNSKQYGIQWPENLSASGMMQTQNSNLQTSSIVGKDFTVQFKALSEKGVAKVLSNPKLLCTDGVPSSFLAGGEIPIRLLSERVADVMFKPYGVELKILAKINPHSSVTLKMLIKVSDIDAGLSVDGIPGIAQHHIETTADLEMGQTIVLGGLLQTRDRKNVRKVPLLGQVPIIGELFKSRAFQNNQSEFFVTLTPHRSDSVSPMQTHLLGLMTQHQNNKKPYQFSIFD